MVREKRRIAFFGGTFDPVHNGHLEMAEAALEQLRLQRVSFVPAGRNPLKTTGPFASEADRLEMLRLGIAGHPWFSIWEGELGRDGPSYTLHSVEHIERVYPNAHLFWLIGSDQLENLRNWFGVEQLVRKISFILVMRPGHGFTWPGIPGLRVYPVGNPLNPVSATEIRSRIWRGQSLEGLVPPAVEAYIHRNGLYREADQGEHGLMQQSGESEDSD